MDSSEDLMNIVVSLCQCRNVGVVSQSLSVPTAGLNFNKKGKKKSFQYLLANLRIFE